MFYTWQNAIVLEVAIQLEYIAMQNEICMAKHAKKLLCIPQSVFSRLSETAVIVIDLNDYIYFRALLALLPITSIYQYNRRV